MRTPTPTLQRVADAAGVHRSTASRALNAATAHLLSPAVAERIQEASRLLGYRRDVVAASLRTRRSLLVGVLVPDIANPVFGPILSGIEAVLAARGYSALIANALDPARQVAAAHDLIARRVEGMVLATAQRRDPALTACLDAGIPAVLVNRAEADGEAGPRACAVVSDDGLGMRMAVEHLVGLGHTAIGHIAGPANLSTGALRRQGFEAAMAAAGLRGPIVGAAAFTREAGLPAALDLLRRGVTAIVAANDLLALGAYQALAQRGLACPADVSVVGHNDMPLVDMVQPPLTTVRIRPCDMGREAATLLLGRIATPASAPVLQVIRPEFVRRGSTAARSSRPGPS